MILILHCNSTFRHKRAEGCSFLGNSDCPVLYKRFWYKTQEVTQCLLHFRKMWMLYFPAENSQDNLDLNDSVCKTGILRNPETLHVTSVCISYGKMVTEFKGHLDTQDNCLFSHLLIIKGPWGRLKSWSLLCISHTIIMSPEVPFLPVWQTGAVPHAGFVILHWMFRLFCCKKQSMRSKW